MPDWDDYDYANTFVEEYDEDMAYKKALAKLEQMTPEELAKEWVRECNRHDSAVDRCEQINSPTIESAAGWMKTIERIFKDRGLQHWDYTQAEYDRQEKEFERLQNIVRDTNLTESYQPILTPKQQRQQAALDHMEDRMMVLEEYEFDFPGRAESLRFLNRVRSATRYNLDMSLGIDPEMTGGMTFNDPRWKMIYNMR